MIVVLLGCKVLGQTQQEEKQQKQQYETSVYNDEGE